MAISLNSLRLIGLLSYCIVPTMIPAQTYNAVLEGQILHNQYDSLVFDLIDFRNGELISTNSVSLDRTGRFHLEIPITKPTLVYYHTRKPFNVFPKLKPAAWKLLPMIPAGIYRLVIGPHRKSSNLYLYPADSLFLVVDRRGGWKKQLGNIRITGCGGERNQLIADLYAREKNVQKQKKKRTPQNFAVWATNYRDTTLARCSDSLVTGNPEFFDWFENRLNGKLRGSIVTQTQEHPKRQRLDYPLEDREKFLSEHFSFYDTSNMVFLSMAWYRWDQTCFDAFLKSRHIQKSRLSDSTWIRRYEEFLDSGNAPDAIKAMRIAKQFDMLQGKKKKVVQAQLLSTLLLRKYPNSQYAPKFRQIVAAAQADYSTGRPAPSIRLPRIRTPADTITMDSLRSKVVYMDIWATWCRPCMGEVPKLKTLHDKFAGQPVEFVGISVDKDVTTAQGTVQRMAMPGIQLHSPGDFDAPIVLMYRIQSIPRFILIGKDGNIINADAPRPGTPEAEEAIRKALAN